MKKITILIIFLSFICFYQIETYAFGEVASEAPNMSFDKACKIHSADRINVKIRTVFKDGKEKHGYVYRMTLGKHLLNGVLADAPAFCLNPDKKNNTPYTRGSLLRSDLINSIDIYYYKVYQWYLDYNGVYNGDELLIAQSLIWHLYNRQSTAHVDETFAQVYYTSICSTYESRIGSIIENPDFSCECFIKGSTTSGCNGKIIDKSGPRDVDLSIEKYVKIFEENKLELNFNEYSSLKNKVKKYTEIAYDILTDYPKYPGKLYIWRPAGGDDYQYLIGVYGCPPDDETKTCVTEVEKLKDDFDVDERKDTNTAYMAEIVRLTTKYPEQFNATDLTNPKCDPDPPIDRPPECPPTYEETNCSFYNPNNNGGFYMSDAKNGDDPKEACYLDNDIAYKTDGGEVVSSKDDDLSNEYCTLYCWEAFGADFPAAIANIKAGTKFFWGRDIAENMFGNLSAVRKCKTTNINYDQFIADWSANETAIATSYNSYSAQKAYNAATNLTKGDSCLTDQDDSKCIYTSSGTGCEPYNKGTDGKCYNYAAHDPGCTTVSGTPHQNIPGLSSDACLVDSWNPSPTSACTSCNDSNYSASNGHCYKKGTNYTKTQQTVGGQKSSDTQTICVPNTIANDKINDEVNSRGDFGTVLTNRQNTVSQLIGGRKTLSTKIEACQSKSVTNENSMYEYKGKVVLNYSDPAGVDRNIQSPIELENYKSDISVITNGVSSGAIATRCESTPDIKNGDNCFTNNTLATYSSYEWNFTGLWYYKYSQSDFYWRSIVENAHVVNEKTYTADYSGMKIVPYELGYGIPTAFSLKTGFYEISVDVTGFGNQGTHFDKLLQEENVSVYNYACPYHVVNELYGMECNFQCDFNTRTCTLTADSPAYCDNEVKGIDLVYRVIEMASGDTKTIFPSIDGDGRNPGTNWSTFIADKSKAYKNITTPSVIYDDEPIYEIDLTPTLINQIRRDNLTYREQNMDPYTSYTDANNQEKVICEGVDTNRTCASHYITELINQNVLNGEYADCHNCGSTAERLKYIDSMKERYNN